MYKSDSAKKKKKVCIKVVSAKLKLCIKGKGIVHTFFF